MKNKKFTFIVVLIISWNAILGGCAYQLNNNELNCSDFLPKLESEEVVSLYSNKIKNTREIWEQEYGAMLMEWAGGFIGNFTGDSTPELIFMWGHQGIKEIILYEIKENTVQELDSLTFTGKECSGEIQVGYNGQSTYLILSYDSFILDSYMIQEWKITDQFIEWEYLGSEQHSLNKKKCFSGKRLINEEEFNEKKNAILMNPERKYLLLYGEFNGLLEETETTGTLTDYLNKKYEQWGESQKLY